MTALETAEAFVAAINARDVGGLIGLMTPAHVLVDADGTEHVGRDRVGDAWRTYFELVPDYRIEVGQRFTADDTVVLLGRASGTFSRDGELKPENHWSVPAAWRVIVDSGRVAVWQLYVNQHPMHEILERPSGGAPGAVRARSLTPRAEGRDARETDA